MSKKRNPQVLGRGLDAILKSPETDITAGDISGNFVAGAIAEVEIKKIEANPFQPRTDFDEMMLRELSDSIKAQGVIQPITIRKLGYDKYQLIAGERRFRASKMAGLKKIPAFIRVANDEQMLEMALIENVHRQDLNAIEIAISYQRLMDELNLTHEQLSEKVGKNRSTITNFIRLLKLPPTIQVSLRDGHISMGHARALLSLEDEAQQNRVLKMVIQKGLSVRQVEVLVRNMTNSKVKTKEASSNKIPEKYRHIPDELSQLYGTKVNFKRNNNGMGNFVINFKSDDELERILMLLKK
ncbi:MAG: chromosome partitioning protein ParB [Bacteroidetes bacterium]|nr:MAG: chromosome partitioning protein ParB [Bacteroidota bacterium]